MPEPTQGNQVLKKMMTVKTKSALPSDMPNKYPNIIKATSSTSATTTPANKNSRLLGIIRNILSGLSNIWSNINPASEKNVLRGFVENRNNPDYWKNEAKKRGIDLTK